jgi:hypothetical protein
LVWRNEKAANWMGSLSLLLSVIPVIYINHADAFPNSANTEFVVLFVFVGGSLLLALSAGLIGSRWWFVAILGAVIDAVAMWLVSP